MWEINAGSVAENIEWCASYTDSCDHPAHLTTSLIWRNGSGRNLSECGPLSRSNFSAMSRSFPHGKQYWLILIVLPN